MPTSDDKHADEVYLGNEVDKEVPGRPPRCPLVLATRTREVGKEGKNGFGAALAVKFTAVFALMQVIGLMLAIVASFRRQSFFNLAVDDRTGSIYITDPGGREPHGPAIGEEDPDGFER